MEVGQSGSSPEPVEMGPSDLTKLWSEIHSLFSDAEVNQYNLYSHILGYTLDRRASIVEEGRMPAFVSSERLQGVLGLLEIDIVLTDGGSPDDPDSVLKALSIEVSASDRPLLRIRGDKAWREGAENVIERFFENRRSASESKRAAVGLIAGALMFAVSASVPYLVGFGIGGGFLLLNLAYSVLLGSTFGALIFGATRRWFPVSRVYVDTKTGRPSRLSRWTEEIALGAVAAIICSWVLAFVPFPH